MRKDLKALKQSFYELNASHESLKEDHKELGKAHTKLEKAHSSLLDQGKKEVVLTCDVGSTCDLINESFYEPIIVAPTNPSCSTCTSTSPFSDGFTCDASLMVENETLKKEVNELTRALGYIPKKGKAAFVTPKASFVKGNGRFCNRCKQVGHIE